MKKVLIRYYNKNNLGDDLFVRMLVTRYKNQFTTILLKQNRSLESLKNIKIKASKLAFFVTKIFEKLSRRRNLLLSRLTFNEDLLVYAGGSIFIEKNNLNVWKLERKFYSDLSIPYYILGSNIGPYKTQEFLDIVSHIFKGAADVCLRDSRSLSLISDPNKSRVAADMIFSLEAPDVKQSKSAVISVIDCRSRLDKQLAKKYEKTLIEITKKLMSDGYFVTFMSFCKAEGDEKAIRQLLRMIDGDKSRLNTHFYRGNIDKALEVIGSSEIVVGTRLHSIILGLAFGKNVLPIAYSDKALNVLDDIDFTGTVIDLRDPEDIGLPMDLRRNTTKLSASKRAELKSSAEQQFDGLDQVLERRSNE